MYGQSKIIKLTGCRDFGIEIIRSEITRSLVAVVLWLNICTDQWFPLYSTQRGEVEQSRFSDPCALKASQLGSNDQFSLECVRTVH